MSAAREPDQADFDLERFIDMLDTALTSNDPRVVETLRKLLMIVALTKPETSAGASQGPLRRLFEDLNHLNRRMHRMDEEIHQLNRARFQEREVYQWEDRDKYRLAAAQGLAAQIDQDVMRKLSAQTATAINGGLNLLGPENKVKVKGLK